jgi:hypothetical protein
MTLVKPLKRSVTTVDGITDNPLDGSKLVMFTWQYRDVPDFVAVHGGLSKKDKYQAVAAMRLFDDGWRMEDVELH